jgi:hypothetical protein
MLKKKSDAKSFNKAINKYGLDEPHLATELAAATATYFGSRGTNTTKKWPRLFPTAKKS